MTAHMARVAYGVPVEPPSFQCVVVSAFAFEATITRLKAALQDQELWLLHEIDPQMLLHRGGYEILATRQLLFFHPRYMARLLAIDPNAVIEAPLKLVIMQMPDGRVTVRFVKVETTLGRYDSLVELATELTTICLRLVQTVTDDKNSAEPTATHP